MHKIIAVRNSRDRRRVRECVMLTLARRTSFDTRRRSPRGERGLKPGSGDNGMCAEWSLPTGGRGLKLTGRSQRFVDLASLPTRERGLKLCYVAVLPDCTGSLPK